jgi:hypothetical protein
MLHLNFFQFNESMTNTDLIRYSKAYIIKFQSDFSRLSVLVPFLSKLLKFHLLILKPFSPNFHFFLPFLKFVFLIILFFKYIVQYHFFKV